MELLIVAIVSYTKSSVTTVMFLYIVLCIQQCRKDVFMVCACEVCVVVVHASGAVCIWKVYECILCMHDMRRPA